LNQIAHTARNIPNTFHAWNLLQEPRLTEGLTSGDLSRKSGTFTLVYSAPWYAEALVDRSAKSLKERYGMELSLLMDPITNSGKEGSEDECIITKVGQVQKELVSAHTPEHPPGEKTGIK